MTQATKHCHSTTYNAHLLPSSRLMAAIAATQGVYSKLKTSIEAAATGVKIARIAS